MNLTLHYAPLLLTAGYLLASSPELQASLAGEVVESLVKTGGRFVDDASKLAARKAIETAALKYGDEVIETLERGGFGLAEAAVRHGDDVWRFARLTPDAPRMLAARAEPILAIGKRWGDDAARIEMKAPACAEALAGKLPAKRLGEIAEAATPREIQRLAALATHRSPRELEVAMTLWKRSNGKVLEHLTPARIAAYGFSMAAVIAACSAPEAFIGLVQAALTGLLGPLVSICGWLLVFAFIIIARKPIKKLLRRFVGVLTRLWRMAVKPAALVKQAMS